MGAFNFGSSHGLLPRWEHFGLHGCHFTTDEILGAPATRLDAALALQVEITPREILGLTGDNEARYAYQEYMGENRLVRQLTGSPPWGKGGWKGSSKDPPFPQKREERRDRFNQQSKGGRRAPESRVVEPEE